MRRNIFLAEWFVAISRDLTIYPYEIMFRGLTYKAEEGKAIPGELGSWCPAQCLLCPWETEGKLVL